MNRAEALLAGPGAIAATRRPLVVQARFAESEGRVDTLEGGIAYQAGDAIVTGTEGEQWPVARAVFLGSYEPIQPLQQGFDGRYRRLPLRVRAVRLHEPLAVPTGTRDTLHGKPGDWLVRHANGDYGIVRADIFDKTYAPAGPAD